MDKPLVGVLVGGASSRMGGAPKGLIALQSGETILERTLRIAREAGLDTILVGDLDAYDAIAKAVVVPRIPDASDVKGPLAGLKALLEHARQRDVIAIACDMPLISVALLQRLADEALDAHVLAPRSIETNKWEPLCARYRSPNVLHALHEAIASGEQSFQQLLRRLNVTELVLSEEERSATIDWDTPHDVTR